MIRSRQYRSPPVSLDVDNSYVYKQLDKYITAHLDRHRKRPDVLPLASIAYDSLERQRVRIGLRGMEYKGIPIVRKEAASHVGG